MKLLKIMEQVFMCSYEMTYKTHCLVEKNKECNRMHGMLLTVFLSSVCI